MGLVGPATTGQNHHPSPAQGGDQRSVSLRRLACCRAAPLFRDTDGAAVRYFAQARREWCQWRAPEERQPRNTSVDTQIRSLESLSKKLFDFLCVRSSLTYNVTVHVHVLWPVFTHVLIRCRHTVDTHTNNAHNTHMRPPYTHNVSVSFFYVYFLKM